MRQEKVKQFLRKNMKARVTQKEHVRGTMGEDEIRKLVEVGQDREQMS